MKFRYEFFSYKTLLWNIKFKYLHNSTFIKIAHLYDVVEFCVMESCCHVVSSRLLPNNASNVESLAQHITELREVKHGQTQ